ncbi:MULTISPECIES: DUF1877 family protein [Mucilaginibacter]|uniref:DUF1877 family protein n=1 Tax=Mucilaginibacter TaxID=423349 RepID=UPI00159D67FA|nr:MULTISPECIES: DUF1877 family protein [Mucilaginibacter]NVM62421.1 hypothetical protein [Mucilaginibacter sp. SG538B]GGB06885.1 hypothetical protein GCM10011500_23290 [Mucilaginibacter rubeus]
MGQSASLYQVTNADFLKIADNLNDLNLFDIAKSSRHFDKSFEGLRFVLSKNRDTETTDLVQEIFYPVLFLGEEIDYANFDFENTPDDFDSVALYFHDPSKVALINQLLELVSNDDFVKSFNADELNTNDIYPGKVWSTGTGDDHAFNITHMLQEFINLKKVFNSAAIGNDYVICTIG